MRLPAFMRHPLTLAAIAFALMGLLNLYPGDGETGAGLPLMKLGLALLGILALVVAAVPFLKRLPASGQRRGSRLRCEEQLNLDARHRLALVSVDGHTLLLGLNSDGFILLKDMPAPLEELGVPDGDVQFPSSEKLKQLFAERSDL